MDTSRQAIHSRIYFFLLSAICLSMPFVLISKGFPFVSYIIGPMMVNWVVELGFGRKVKSLFNNKLALLFSSLYILYLIGLWNTSNYTEAGKDLITKLTLFVFPVIIFTSEKLSKEKILLLLRFFIYGCLAACLILLGAGIYRFPKHGITTFYYEYLAAPLNIHPSYLSLYLVIAFFICVFFAGRMFGEISRREKIFFMSTALVLLLTVLLLFARTQIIFLVLAVICTCLVYAIKRKRYVLAAVLPSLLILALIASYHFSKVPKARADKALQEIQNFSESSDNSSNVGDATDRAHIWKSSVEVLSNNLPFGVGTGDARDELVKQYQTNGLTKAADKQLNSHNQFLQTTIAIGLPGIIILLLTLIIPLWLSIKQRSYLYLLFLAAIIFSFLTESMLEVQSGTIFFGLFNSLLALGFLQDKSLEKK